MAKKINFTIKNIDGLEHSSGSNWSYYYDTQLPGLAIGIGSSGKKTFLLYKKINYKPERIKIGAYPDISIEQARKKAKELIGKIALGENPQDAKRQIREEMTLGELFDQYMSDYAIEQCTGWKETQANFERYYGHWRTKKLSHINKHETQQHFNKIGKENGHHTANRSLDIVRAVWNWGIRFGYTSKSNPFTCIRRFKTQSRERFILPEELEKFMKALDAEKNIEFRDYVLLSLLFGARQFNILSMRWDQIDFDLGLWRIPKTKNGEAQILPITQRTHNLLKERQSKSKSVWVFPSVDSKTGHYVEPKTSWKKLLKRAKITNLRMHDLRRTLGSYLALTNFSLPIIGKVLGHKSATATQIYARLANDPIRQAMETAQEQIFALAEKYPIENRHVPTAANQ